MTNREDIEDTIKPVLLVDVDGVLNPFQMKTRKAEGRGFSVNNIVIPGEGTFEVFISSSMMKALFEMQETFDLVWCTTWNHWANKLILPLAGFDFPEFPVLELGVPQNVSNYLGAKPFWKTPQVVEAFTNGDYAGRRFAWIDDGVSHKVDKPYLRRYFNDHIFKLGFVNPGIGLTEELENRLTIWAHNSEEENTNDYSN